MRKWFKRWWKKRKARSATAYIDGAETTMPRADVTIRFSTNQPANAYLTGAGSAGEAAAPSAQNPDRNDQEVDTTGSLVSSASGTVTTFTVDILTIPDITLDVGETHDMGQYINPALNVTSTQILNLDTNVATYDSSTQLLTGVAVGTISGAQLEVTYSIATLAKTTFPKLGRAQLGMGNSLWFGGGSYQVNYPLTGDEIPEALASTNMAFFTPDSDWVPKTDSKNTYSTGGAFIQRLADLVAGYMADGKHDGQYITGHHGNIFEQKMNKTIIQSTSNASHDRVYKVSLENWWAKVDPIGSVSGITNSGGVLTVTENNHGRSNGDGVWIQGATGGSGCGFNVPGRVESATTNTYQIVAFPEDVSSLPSSAGGTITAYQLNGRSGNPQDAAVLINATMEQTPDSDGLIWCEWYARWQYEQFFDGVIDGSGNGSSTAIDYLIAQVPNAKVFIGSDQVNWHPLSRWDYDSDGNVEYHLIGNGADMDFVASYRLYCKAYHDHIKNIDSRLLSFQHTGWITSGATDTDNLAAPGLELYQVNEVDQFQNAWGGDETGEGGEKSVGFNNQFSKMMNIISWRASPAIQHLDLHHGLERGDKSGLAQNPTDDDHSHHRMVIAACLCSDGYIDSKQDGKDHNPSQWSDVFDNAGQGVEAGMDTTANDDGHTLTDWEWMGNAIDDYEELSNGLRIRVFQNAVAWVLPPSKEDDTPTSALSNYDLAAYVATKTAGRTIKEIDSSAAPSDGRYFNTWGSGTTISTISPGRREGNVYKLV